MRIAYVTQNIDRGDGQGRVCLELARHALLAGHEVSLFTNFTEPELIAIGARWVPLHPNKWRASLFTVRHFAFLADRALPRFASELDLIHGFGFSLSHPHQVNSAQFVHRSWNRSNAHPIRSSKTPYALYHWLYTRLNMHWEQAAFAQAKLVVGCSQMVKSELREVGIPEAKLRAVCNGVDLMEFAPDSQKRSALNLPEGVPLFLFAGDIRTPRKNLGTVLRAVKQVPQAHLVVVGALPGSPYPAMAESLEISSRVHFLGFRKDLPAIMGAVDAFVFPSEYEPFGMVVLEAMASGIPVITAATVGASTLVSSASGIVLQNPNDAAALAAAMRNLMDHPEERMTMGKAGRATAESYSWEKMTDAYLSIYDEVATARKHTTK